MHPVAAELFDETLQKSGAWVAELMQALGYTEARPAYALLRAVLHALRDRVTVATAAKLGAQLPLLIRGVYYEGWHPAATPVKLRHKSEFLERIRQSCPGLDETEHAVGIVLAQLSQHLSAGEIQHLKDELPAELRSLWPF